MLGVCISSCFDSGACSFCFCGLDSHHLAPFTFLLCCHFQPLLLVDLVHGGTHTGVRLEIRDWGVDDDVAFQ